MLHCPKCKTTKENTNFYKNKNRKSGYNSYCIECLKQSIKTTVAKTKAAFVELSDLTCTKCHVTKPVKGNFGKNAKSANGYFPVCYACQKQTYKNPAKVALQWRKFRSTVLVSRRRENILRVFGLVGACCAACKRPASVETFGAYDLHHTDPQSKSFGLGNGKLDKIWNTTTELEVLKCVLLCACCHRNEHTKKLLNSKMYEQTSLIYKKLPSCEDCGLLFTADNFHLADFHHTNPEIKTTSAKRLVLKRNLSGIELKELESCSILCAYCHRLRHSS